MSIFVCLCVCEFRRGGTRGGGGGSRQVGGGHSCVC